MKNLDNTSATISLSEYRVHTDRFGAIACIPLKVDNETITLRACGDIEGTARNNLIEKLELLGREVKEIIAII